MTVTSLFETITEVNVLRLASERCAEDDCPFIRLCLLVGCFADHALACREDKWRLEAEANIFIGDVGRVLRVEVWFDNARNTGRWEPTYFTKLLD